MAHVKSGIQIIHYQEDWAKAVAKMWNLSRDGWGGDTRVMTEEQVKQKEANSDNIELYLAVDGDEVVGYCSLSEYKEDTGSLYIPLLNVRPDYHGKKIGKMLVLRAVEKTIELGWPRLDLYTWPGNTKAVPLYKKCGFFWEDRDDTTHLMNFIPLVMNTPLLNPVFSELDWYDSSDRIIEVKPDGSKSNGFTYYEYSWKNEKTYARVQFERTSRGMSLIETDDYFLQISLVEHEVIENEPLNFQIKFLNKTDKDVKLKASGSGSERVQYHVDADIVVEKEATFINEVTVKPGDEPSPWRTHPFIVVNVWVDGQACELKLGVFPVQSGKIEAYYSGNICYLNKETSIELVVKNNLKEDADFEILFPEGKNVSLTNNIFTVQIPAGERKNVVVPLVVNEHGFYNPTLHVKAKKKDGTVLIFEQDISVAFKGLGKKFGGESKEYWHIYNGLCQVNIRKRDLLLTAAKNSLKKQPLAFFPPKLGKPYSNEFSKKKPNYVSWETNDSSVLLKMELASSEMEGLYVTQFVQLFGDGIVENWVEIDNRGPITFENVAIILPHYHELGKTYFPLDEQVVCFSENRIIEFGDLRPSSITGNWYFTESAPEPIGISWSENSKATPDGWQFVIENEIGMIAPGEKKTTENVTLAIGAFSQWEDFRAYASESSFVDKSEISGEYLFKSNNIVVDTNLALILKNFRNSYLEGQVNVKFNEKEFFNTKIHSNEETNEYTFDIPAEKLEPLSVIECHFKENSMTSLLRELVLSPSDKTVVSNISTEDGFETIEANNGCISIKTAPDYYPGIFSLKINGSEWLDNSFPHITAKSWWNPWAGGMKTVPQGMNTFSLKKEAHRAYPVEKMDVQGNKWSGIAIRTEIKEHAGWKGVQFVQYYLLLPDIPIMATYVEVKDAAGKNLKEESWVTDFFIGGEELPNYFIHASGNGLTSQYQAGIQELPTHFEANSYVSSVTKLEKLFIVPSSYRSHSELYTNKDAILVLENHSAQPKSNCHKTAPLFMVFDARVLDSGLLQKLRTFQF